MPNISITTRDVARELARRYSTMTHEELDMLESILVPMKFAKNEMILKPGQQATLNAQSSAFNVRTVSTEKYTNWRDGYFYYDNMPVKDILLAIGRNYNIDVVCESPALLTERMRFVATRGSDLNDILSRLNDIGKIRAMKVDGKIIVK